MMTAIYIGLGGALGSISRYLFGNWALKFMGERSQLPLGTLGVNILGAFLMGFLVALIASRGVVDARVRLILGVGFLGGFTTYSSFALETIGLWEEKSFASASWYVGLTLLCAGFACFAGLYLGRRL